MSSMAATAAFTNQDWLDRFFAQVSRNPCPAAVLICNERRCKPAPKASRVTTPKVAPVRVADVGRLIGEALDIIATEVEVRPANAKKDHPWRLNALGLAKMDLEIKQKTDWSLRDVLAQMGIKSLRQWKGDPDTPEEFIAQSVKLHAQWVIRGAPVEKTKKPQAARAKVSSISKFWAAVSDGGVHVGKANREINAMVKKHDVKEAAGLPHDAWVALQKDMSNWETQAECFKARQVFNDLAIGSNGKGFNLDLANRLIKEYKEENGDGMVMADWEALGMQLEAAIKGRAT